MLSQELLMFKRGIGNILRISFPANFAVFIMNVSCFRDRFSFMMWSAQQAFLFVGRAHGEGGGGCVLNPPPARYSTNVYTGRLRLMVQPLTLLYTIFHKKGTPFVYLSLTNGTPWVASKIYFHWVNCPFYLHVKLFFTLTSLETCLQSTIKIKSVGTIPEI